jgi:splicing factor 3A subunit 2
MVNIFLRAYNNTTHLLSINPNETYQEFHSSVSSLLSIPSSFFYLTTQGGKSLLLLPSLPSLFSEDGVTIDMKLKIRGGIDFQHREGSKIGSGGNLSESQAALERKERLRKLALETIDITKDPYILRNHLGTYECKLCLTLHNNEGNYLAHTQGKRHQVFSLSPSFFFFLLS